MVPQANSTDVTKQGNKRNQQREMSGYSVASVYNGKVFTRTDGDIWVFKGLIV